MSRNEAVDRGTDAETPPDFAGGTARIGLFQDRNDLCLGELPVAHGKLLAKVDYFSRKLAFEFLSDWGSVRYGLDNYRRMIGDVLLPDGMMLNKEPVKAGLAGDTASIQSINPRRARARGRKGQTPILRLGHTSGG